MLEMLAIGKHSMKPEAFKEPQISHGCKYVAGGLVLDIAVRNIIPKITLAILMDWMNSFFSSGVFNANGYHLLRTMETNSIKLIMIHPYASN